MTDKDYHCKHPGCKEGLHITHPCEVCGRIGGRIDYPAIGARVMGWDRGPVVGWYIDKNRAYVKGYQPHKDIAQAMAVLQAMVKDGWWPTSWLSSWGVHYKLAKGRHVFNVHGDAEHSGDLGADTAKAIMEAISKAKEP